MSHTSAGRTNAEAEFRRAGLPANGVTWGGHQDAADGGIDVRAIGYPSSPNGFIPRSNSGFQVKKGSLSLQAVINEMKPKGRLRDSIRKLIQNKGAYVIVSGTSSSDLMLRNRIKAMAKAIQKEPGKANLYVDYFDSSRLASWVRSHPDLILWVRNKIGLPLKGWQPFANWSGNPGDPTGEYILDNSVRIQHSAASAEREMSAKSGLQRMRAMLTSWGVSLRFVGLSGVGKTRFVQALFQDGVAEPSLNRNLAIYTNMADSPDPDPKTLAEQLIAKGYEAILIVDNCPPDLHRRLTTACSGQTTNLNLLTIEYDVRDDLPEQTDVFIMEPSSDDVIVKLVQQRFKYISDIDARSIAHMPNTAILS